MSIMKLRMNEVAAPNAREFFESVVPTVLEARKNLGLKGIIGISLTGEGGGRWIVDLNEAKVVENGEQQPECVLEMEGTDFQAALMHKLDVQAAIQGGKIKLGGNPALFGALATLLQP